ncbi:hypothetical protein [Streptomyces malaysiensis]|uniref:Uncharacterized protein n=1 Tax=Streptomyces malaysiensis TaxID=92644 RepID=A0A7X5X7R9_STRMQ|nr:hypothetical protein [Streptomyces malaysiensis]NIY68112.1 hypothetical protein [Streptomyces malaysiensis]
MFCTHIDLSGNEPADCGNEDFDLTVSAMLTVDLSGTEEDRNIELDGLGHEDITLICKKCGNPLDDADAVKTATVLILKLEKRFGVTLKPFSSYTFEDGTVVRPEQLQVTPLQDVTVGAAYQEAVKYQAQYRAWKAAQLDRIEAGEIDVLDLNVMETPWRQAIVKRHIALLEELAPASAEPLETN